MCPFGERSCSLKPIHTNSEPHRCLSISWSNEMILSAVYRGLSPALLQSSVPSRARGGSRINHSMMKQMHSQVVVRSSASSFSDLFLGIFFIHMSALLHSLSLIATHVPLLCHYFLCLHTSFMVCLNLLARWVGFTTYK